MNAQKTPEEQLVDVVSNEANRIMRAAQGSGAKVDDPCQIGRMHSLLAPMTEKMLVSVIYGKENRDWFDAGRDYHKNGAICEQRVRLDTRAKPKQSWAQPGHTYSMFFDISGLTQDAPIPEDVRQLFMRLASKIPVPEASVASDFPIIEVQAENAVEAARVISRHLRAAEAKGWKVGRAFALLDNWRNEYELTRGNEKTVMQFDMRPCLLSDSPLNLTMLTLIVTQPNGEQALREFEGSMRPSAASNRTSTVVARHERTNVTENTLSDDTIHKMTPWVVLLTLFLSVLSAMAATRFLHSPLEGVISFFVGILIWMLIVSSLAVKVAHRFYAWRRKRIRPSSH
jgi:hypothetical protein